MTIRESYEITERERLSSFASFSDSSRGRYREPGECDIRSCFQRDVDRIIYSKAFRRLKHKTQVFLQPEGDHYRTRMTHTLEVSRIARTIARALRLNEDLTEAIAYGHDLGHTPFGHAGEKALSEVLEGGFRHNEQSLRVVDLLEKDGRGLNLTYEVRMGILTHTGEKPPETAEAQIVRLADKIGYINHDMDDAVRAGILCEDALPGSITDILGHSITQRIDTLIRSAISTSAGQRDVRLAPEVEKAMLELREFMFEHVYRNPVAKGEEYKAREILRQLFDHYVKNKDEMPPEFLIDAEKNSTERAACDYIAGMTDKYAVFKFSEIFIPGAWQMR